MFILYASVSYTAKPNFEQYIVGVRILYASVSTRLANAVIYIACNEFNAKMKEVVRSLQIFITFTICKKVLQIFARTFGPGCSLMPNLHEIFLL